MCVLQKPWVANDVLNTDYLGCHSHNSLMCPVFCSYGNSALKTETEMFEKYYSRLEPRDHRMPRLSDIKITAAEFSQVHNEKCVPSSCLPP